MHSKKPDNANIGKDILELYAQDPNKALPMLIQTYGKKLYFTARKILLNHDDSDDAVQNAYVIYWKKLGTFNGKSQLYTWLHRILVNESLKILNKKKNNLSLSDDYSLVSNISFSDVYMDGNEIEKKLFDALKSLPEKQRLVFQMKYYEEKKYSEISELLGTSIGALKASYHLAVKKIKNQLNLIDSTVSK